MRATLSGNAQPTAESLLGTANFSMQSHWRRSYVFIPVLPDSFSVTRMISSSLPAKKAVYAAKKQHRLEQKHALRHVFYAVEYKQRNAASFLFLPDGAPHFFMPPLCGNAADLHL